MTFKRLLLGLFVMAILTTAIFSSNQDAFASAPSLSNFIITDPNTAGSVELNWIGDNANNHYSRVLRCDAGNAAFCVIDESPGVNPNVISVGIYENGYMALGTTTYTDLTVSGDTTYSYAIQSTHFGAGTIGASGNTGSTINTIPLILDDIHTITTVTDPSTVGPVIILTGASPQTIELGAGYTELGATATDNIDATITIVIDATAFDDAVGSYQITYDATDTDSNDAVQLIRTVNVVDTTDPIITLVGANPQTIELSAGYTELGATIFDLATSPLVIDATAFDDAVGSYTIYYDSTDASNNVATQVTRTVNVQDTTVPTFDVNGETSDFATNVLFNGVYTVGSIFNVVELDTPVESIVGDGAVDASVANQVYYVTYTVTDASENFLTITETVTIGADLVGPVITDTSDVIGTTTELEAVNSHNALCNVSDNDTAYSEVCTVTNEIDTSVVGEQTDTFSAPDDAAGNIATGTTGQTTTVVDTTDPTFNVDVSGTEYTFDFVTNLIKGVDTYVQGTFEAQSDISGIASIVIAGDTVVDTVGLYVVTYTVTDNNGNTSVISETVNVRLGDTPIITLSGSTPVVVQLNVDTYTDDGATATDTEDDNTTLTAAIVTVNDNVDESVIFQTIITYDVTDSSGNDAIQVTRTVNVVDTQVPIITLTGSDITLIKDVDTYTELGATVTDNDPTTSASATIGGDTVNVAIISVYTVTYDVVDDSGNDAVQVTRTVTVTAGDTPVFTLTGNTTPTHEFSTTYTDAGTSTCEDTEDGTIAIVETGSVNVEAEGANVLTFTCTDSSNNEFELTRTVTVADSVTPVIVPVDGNLNQILVLGIDTYTEQEASVSDANDQAYVEIVTIIGTVNNSVAAEYIITYSAPADQNGNTPANVVRTVNVIDETAPTVIVNIVDSSLSDSDNTSSVTFEFSEVTTDFADNDLTVVGGTISAFSGSGTSYIATFTATDGVTTTGSVTVDALSYTDAANNNGATGTDTVDIDTENPIIACNPDVNIQLNLETFVENCTTATDAVTTVTNNAVNPDETALGDYIITYAAQDAAGNDATTDLSRTVSVIDTTDPILTRVQSNPQIIYINDSVPSLTATVSDNNVSDNGEIVDCNESAVVNTVVDDYIVTCDYTDFSGNNAVQLTYTVKVSIGNIPVITLTGSDPITLTKDVDTYDELGATVTDIEDGASSAIVGGDTVDESIVDTYVITYDATDASGNDAVQVTRTVNVIAGGTPVITLTGTSPDIIRNIGTYDELGATADDTEDGNGLTVTDIDSSAINTNSLGLYDVTYDYQDLSGNNAVQVIRTVNVVSLECPTPGQEQSGTGCDWIPIECEQGYSQVENTCELDSIQCPTGQEQLLTECVTIQCELGEILVGDECKSKSGGSGNNWKTKGTYGLSWYDYTQFVDDGFGWKLYNIEHSMTLDDNFHTEFDMVNMPTGVSVEFSALGWFANSLKIQEFCFGIPEAGYGVESQSCVEIHYDNGFRNDKLITEIKVVQDSEVIGNVTASHMMVNCNETDVDKQCEITTIVIRDGFQEPLNHKVMMIKGIDQKNKTIETYLNEGFDINGVQFTESSTMQIPSPIKYGGLITITQSEKYSDLWVSEDGKIFEVNSYGSVKWVNQEFGKVTDSGQIDRNHSAFNQLKADAQNKALKVFDSSKLVSELPDSFAYDYTGIDHREQTLQSLDWYNTD